MTIGEKLKSFRTIRKLSQKRLSELSGVSEGAIRKYEAGTRNPKPAQLKRLAQALDLDESAFQDFKFDLINIETIGDALALYFLIEEYIGATYLAIPTKESTDVTTPIPIVFNNSTFNKYLSEWLPVKRHFDNTINSREQFESEDEYNIAVQAAKVLLEQKKVQLSKLNQIL